MVLSRHNNACVNNNEVAKRKKDMKTSRQCYQLDYLKKTSKLHVNAIKQRHELHQVEAELKRIDQERIEKVKKRRIRDCPESSINKGLKAAKCRMKAMENGYLLFSDEIYQAM